MAISWLSALQDLQEQCKNPLEKTEQLIEKDTQWLFDVVEEATALFKKEKEKEEEEVTKDDDKQDESMVSTPPVLLPQTPRVSLVYSDYNFPRHICNHYA